MTRKWTKFILCGGPRLILDELFQSIVQDASYSGKLRLEGDLIEVTAFRIANSLGLLMAFFRLPYDVQLRKALLIDVEALFLLSDESNGEEQRYWRKQLEGYLPESVAIISIDSGRPFGILEPHFQIEDHAEYATAISKTDYRRHINDICRTIWRTIVASLPLDKSFDPREIRHHRLEDCEPILQLDFSGYRADHCHAEGCLEGVGLFSSD